MYIKKFTLRTLYLFIGLSILLNYNIIVFSADTYTWSTTPDSLETSTSTSEPITPNNTLNLQSGAAILIDQNSGQVLYEHNSHEQLRPVYLTNYGSIRFWSNLFRR